MVCIIDDREDVWNHATNLIHVKPYHFFQHTGDINAPPGLDKHEDDEKEGIDLTNIKASVKNTASDEKSTSKDAINGESVQESEKSEVNGPSEEKSDTKVEENVSVSTEEEQPKTNSAKNNGEKVSDVKENDTESDSKDTKSSSQENSNITVPPNKDEDLIEIEDPDDYLMYLEDILKRIHHVFYEKFDRMEAGAVPDLKTVIPEVRSQVLRGTKLVFSGLVPTHVKLEQSKAYQVARSLGAEVTQDLEDDTTHLVAVRPGTAKVNAGRRKRNLKIVTPDWLWACAECWEHVEEKIFPLNNKGSKNRHPPPHCSSPEHVQSYPTHDTPAVRKRTPSGRFMDTINPLMSFSSADIADMDKEVRKCF